MPPVSVKLKCLKPREVLTPAITLGEHIRKRRQEMGLTLKEAGELLETNDWSIINWEKGRTVPKVYRLPAIIRFLGFNPLHEPSTISDRLVAHRMERGLSRKAASHHFGIDISTLRDWEQGEDHSFSKASAARRRDPRHRTSKLDAEMKARWTAVHGQMGAA